MGQTAGSKQRLALVFGGRSSEHEVSLRSATEVLGAVDRERFEPVPIAVTRAGEFRTGSAETPLAELVADGDPVADIGAALRACACVFPLLHGPYGEDGTFQGLLEVFDVPYVGSGVLASSLCMDKAAFKHHVAAEPFGIPVTPGVNLDLTIEGPEAAFARARDAAASFGYPVFVKPANQGSSVGVSRATSPEELDAALELARRYDTRMVVERGIEGAREIELAVLGDGGPDTVVSFPGEIILPEGEWYTYDNKYVDDVVRYAIPVELPEQATAQLRELALRAFRATRCAGLARVDFFVDRSSFAPYLNEVNTLPGFTSISMYPKLMQTIGVPYSDLISRLVDLGISAHARRRGLSIVR